MDRATRLALQEEIYQDAKKLVSPDLWKCVTEAEKPDGKILTVSDGQGSVEVLVKFFSSPDEALSSSLVGTGGAIPGNPTITVECVHYGVLVQHGTKKRQEAITELSRDLEDKIRFALHLLEHRGQ